MRRETRPTPRHSSRPADDDSVSCLRSRGPGATLAPWWFGLIRVVDQRHFPMLQSAIMSRPNALRCSFAVLAVAALAACRADRPAGPSAAKSAAATRGAAAGQVVPEVAAPYADHPNLSIERNVAVPMRDGVVLRADVYRP